MLSQQPDHQHSQDAEQSRRESQREVIVAEDAQRDEREVIERRAVIVFRVVSVLAAVGQVEQEVRHHPFVVVKRFEANLIEAEPDGDDHSQNKGDRADQFLVSAADSLGGLIVHLDAFHMWKMKDTYLNHNDATPRSFATLANHSRRPRFPSRRLMQKRQAIKQRLPLHIHMLYAICHISCAICHISYGIWHIFSLTASSRLRGGLLLRCDRPGVHRGWPRRVSGPARDEEYLHLTAVCRNAAGTHGDAVDVDLDVEAAVGQTVANVLGALDVQVGRPLIIGAIAIDHEPGGRVGLQRRNYAVLQDLLASVVYASVVTLEARTLADLAVRGRRRLYWRRLHGDAGRAAGRTTAGLGSRRDRDVDR